MTQNVKNYSTKDNVNKTSGIIINNFIQDIHVIK